MRILYDKRFDIADILLGDDRAELTSEMVGEDIVLDFAGEKLVRIEVQRASQHLDLDLLENASVYESKVST